MTVAGNAIFSARQVSVPHKAIEYLDSYIDPSHLVFQWGSSFFTFWLADRAAKVYSVESHNKSFHCTNFYKENNAYNNVELKFCPPDTKLDDEYLSSHTSFTDASFKVFCTYIENYPSRLFDLLVIESRLKTKCLDLAVKNGKKGGLVVVTSSTPSVIDNHISSCLDAFSDVKHIGESNLTTSILTIA